MRPLVSVIIPTFNRARYIGEAIDSVIAQHCPETEVIVVDDGSTDDTEARVHSYGDRVRYLRTAHGGVARARNIGTRQARGQFVTYLDSDDRHYPYTLELQARLLERLPEAAFVCAEMSGFDDQGFFERYHLKTYHVSAYRDPGLTYERIFRSSAALEQVCEAPTSLTNSDPRAVDRRVYVGNVFDWYLLALILCQNTVMVRRSVLGQVGERNEGIRYWEGVDLLLRICRRHPIAFVDIPTYQLRYHEGQISERPGAEGKFTWMRKQQILLRVTKRHAFAEPEYYQRHRARIDSHLARLHRAAAVPMLLADGPAARKLRYGRRARPYLARCARYGRPQRALWMMSCLPGPARRLGVTVIERLRRSLSGRWRNQVLAR